MPQSFLNKKVLITLTVTGLVAKIAQLQMFARNDFEITPEQYIILAILVENGELYQRQIAEIAYKDRPNITRLINILEKKGLVKRVEDVQKRKVYKIVITEKGKEIHKKIRPYMLELHNSAVDGITKEELEACINTLCKMLDNLEPKTKIQT